MRLTKQQVVQKAELVARLNAAREKLVEAIEEFNARLVEAYGDVEAVARSYNDIVEEAAALRDDVVEEGRSYFDERSETWQESERGVECSGWLDEWEGAVLDPVDVWMPDGIEEPDTDGADILDRLPDAPE